jgi:hypothetical protein
MSNQEGLQTGPHSRLRMFGSHRKNLFNFQQVSHIDYQRESTTRLPLADAAPEQAVLSSRP